MGQLDEKVALITGAARGQGRCHAVRLAREGAAIIAVDSCADSAVVPYPLASPADLKQTVTEVEALGGRIHSTVADVRDRAELTAAVEAGVERFGRLDIVVANAGVAPVGPDLAESETVFSEVLDVNLTGVWRTVKAAAPHLIVGGRGGSIVITSSAAGLKALGTEFAGTEAYVASKHALVGLMRNFAMWLAPHRIRVNTIHPSGVATPMVENEAMAAFLADASQAVMDSMSNLLPGGAADPGEISETVLWLASDASRHLTGVALPVDGGFTIK